MRDGIKNKTDKTKEVRSTLTDGMVCVIFFDLMDRIDFAIGSVRFGSI